MKYFNLYDKEKTYIFPNGMPANEGTLISNYPLIGQIPFVLETDKTNHIIFSISLLELLRIKYNINEELTDEEAVEEIQTLVNKEEEISDETRIADALEDLVVLNMPDEEVE